MNHPGFMIVPGVVIDSGGSLHVGEWVLDKIARITGKPVAAVLNTHVHGDHWLGNRAVRIGIPNAVIDAHERTGATRSNQSWIALFREPSM